MERSLSEVKRIMGHAKLEKEDHKACVQSLRFLNEIDTEKYKLIEINPEILNCLENGSIVMVRGEKNESAVLCTDKTTYDIKEQETSNMLLLVPQLKLSADLPTGSDTFLLDTDITSIHQKYYELKPMKPKLKKLQTLLEENPFSGNECEDDEDHQGKKYTYADLVELIQASDAEMSQALHKLQACLIDGHWRSLEFDLRGTILDHILRLVDEESWSFDNVPIEKCSDVLKDIFPRNVVEHVLVGFSDCKNTEKDLTTTCKLSEDKICQFFAEMILKPTENFNFSEFEKVWQQSVPEGLKTGLYQLEGLALIDRDSTPQVIRYFPVSNLPEDINERFQALFRSKEKWTADEIMPYIHDLATEKLKPSALLTKYARASTQNGIKVYNSKKPIS